MNDQPQLDSLLKQMADDHRPELPSPGLIWWRAQILRKQEEQARIERPAIIMRLVAIVACLAVFVAMLAANWQQFLTLLGRANWLLLPFAIVTLTASLVSVAVLWPAAKGR